MGFHNVRLPDYIDYGTQGGPGFNTSIVATLGGSEERSSYWSRMRHSYDVSYGIRSHESLTEVKRFFRARLGSQHGFRFKDWDDYTSNEDGKTAPTASDVIIGTGDGSTVQFQLIKPYADAGGSVTRLIERVVQGTVLISLDNTPTAAFSVDHNTGLVTLNSAPAINVIVRAGYEFDVPVRFGEEVEKSLKSSYDFHDGGSFPYSIELVELINEAPISEDLPPGGARAVVMTGDYSLQTDALVYTFDTNGAVRRAILPNQATLPEGGPYFYVYNSGAQNLQIIDSDGTSVLATLATTQSRICLVGVDASGDRVWLTL